MTTLDAQLDEQIEAEARRKLAEALEVLGPQYNEAVKEIGRERHKNFGQKFEYDDFFLGATAIYRLVGDGESLPWPATAWVLQIMGNRNPAYDKDHPELPTKNQWRNQWLIVEVHHHGLGSSGIDIVASCTDEEEAVDLAGFLQGKRTMQGIETTIHTIRVPFPIYTNRDYQQTLDELRKKHWG